MDMKTKCDICSRELPTTIIVSKCLTCNKEHENHLKKEELEKMLVKAKAEPKDMWAEAYIKRRLKELNKK